MSGADIQSSTSAGLQLFGDVDRPCTCPPMERPHPCAKKFALSECKAATMLDPVCYRWRHQKDEVWKYGRQPAHLVPPRGKELIGYYIVQPLYSGDAINALRMEIKRLRVDAERYQFLRANYLHGMSHPCGDAIGMSEVIFGDDVDTAIDAAMQEQKE